MVKDETSVVSLIRNGEERKVQSRSSTGGLDEVDNEWGCNFHRGRGFNSK